MQPPSQKKTKKINKVNHVDLTLINISNLFRFIHQWVNLQEIHFTFYPIAMGWRVCVGVCENVRTFLANFILEIYSLFFLLLVVAAPVKNFVTNLIQIQKKRKTKYIQIQMHGNAIVAIVKTTCLCMHTGSTIYFICMHSITRYSGWLDKWTCPNAWLQRNVRTNWQSPHIRPSPVRFVCFPHPKIDSFEYFIFHIFVTIIVVFIIVVVADVVVVFCKPFKWNYCLLAITKLEMSFLGIFEVGSSDGRNGYRILDNSGDSTSRCSCLCCTDIMTMEQRTESKWQNATQAA